MRMTGPRKLDRSRCCLLVSAILLLLSGCTRTVYVIQNADGSFSETTPIIEPIERRPDDLVVIDVVPSNEYVLIGAEDEALYLQVTVGAREFVSASRAPLNIAIVIDRSGSMSGSKIKDARAAASWLVEHLSDGDKVAIVSYSNDVWLEVPSLTVSPEGRSIAQDAIDRIRTGGNTFLSGGLEAGFAEAKKHYDPEFLNRVVLLSDGLANAGITATEPLSRIADRVREEGISTTTMGVGIDYNEDLMAALAVYGGGNVYFVEDSESLAAVFSDELASLGSTVLRDTVLILELPADVEVERVYGYNFQQHGRELHVEMSSVSAGETRKLLVALKVPQTRDGELVVARGHLDFRNEITRKQQSVSLEPVTVEYTDNALLVADSLNQPVVEKLERVRNAIARREAMQLLDQGDKAGARRVITERIAEGRIKQIQFESDVIDGEVLKLEGISIEVEEASPGSSSYKKTRKLRMEESFDALAY